MSPPRGSCLLALLAASCGASDDPDPRGDDMGPSACELAELLLSESLETLRASEPACQADTDCAVVPLALEARSADVQLCGDVLHREAAAKWDPSAIAREVDRRIGDSAFSCRVRSTCVSFHAACQASRCVGERD